MILYHHSGIYRIIELSGGWDGRIIRTQVYFSMYQVTYHSHRRYLIYLFTDVLDGMMVVLATSIIHM
jgi:hypothetical protein